MTRQPYSTTTSEVRTSFTHRSAIRFNTIKASGQCVNTGQRPFSKKHTKHKLSVKFLEESILQDL